AQRVPVEVDELLVGDDEPAAVRPQRVGGVAGQRVGAFSSTHPCTVSGRGPALRAAVVWTEESSDAGASDEGRRRAKKPAARASGASVESSDGGGPQRVA